MGGEGVLSPSYRRRDGINRNARFGMTLHYRFIAAARLLGGDTPRWQAAAAAKLGISRGHMHSIATGVRPITQRMVVRALDALKAEALDLRGRAERLEAAFESVLPTFDHAMRPTSFDQLVDVSKAYASHAKPSGP